MKEIVPCVVALVVMTASQFVSHPASAQNTFCNTQSGIEKDFELLGTTYPYTHTIQSAEIRVRVHDLQALDGTGDLSDQEIEDILQELYEPYHGIINFRVVGIVDEPTSRYLDFDYIRSPDILDDYNTQDAIDLILTHPDYLGLYAAASSIPGFALVVSDSMITAHHILAHEMGHCLGLWHTDEIVNGVELPDESNCESAGDFICDTAASPTFLGEPAHLRWLVDPYSCEYVPDYYLVFSDYNPDPHNMMCSGYDTHPSCLEVFTSQQFDRMLAMIEYSPILATVVSHVGAAYADRSKDETGSEQMQYQALPYSSATVDYDGLGPRDMVVTTFGGAANLYKAVSYTYSGGIPDYEQVPDAFGGDAGSLLGLAVADVDGDGAEEIFAASQASPRLFRAQGGFYVDVSESWNVNAAAEKSTAGAWADFDCDGDLDLVVGTADCGQYEPGTYNAGPPVADVLLRNDLNTGGTFTDVSVAAGLQPDYFSNSTTVSWGDVNGDGFPDLFVGEFGEPVIGGGGFYNDCRLFVNQQDGTFVDEAESLIGTHAALFTISSTWRDMDNDGDLDLELGQKGSRESLRYDIDEGGVVELVSVAISEDDGAYSGMRVFDYDLDSLEDVVLLPSESSGSPRLLAASDDGSGITYNNVASAAGIGIPGKIGGAVTEDLNSDGDIDLFLGRESPAGENGAYIGDAEHYLFQAKSGDGTSDAPTNFWFSIRLRSPDLMNNHDGIGAMVRVYEPGSRERARMVDGGSGRGGQDGPTMVFGMGQAEVVNSVTVDWPNGYHQVIDGGSINIWTGPGETGENVIEDTSGAAKSVPSVSGRYELVPGGGGVVDWVFTWETNLRTTPAFDQIVFDTYGMAPECAQGLPVLALTTAGVSLVTTNLADGHQRHELTWTGAPCIPGCAIKFWARSSINTTANYMSSSLGTFSVRFCPSN